MYIGKLFLAQAKQTKLNGSNKFCWHQQSIDDWQGMYGAYRAGCEFKFACATSWRRHKCSKLHHDDVSGALPIA